MTISRKASPGGPSSESPWIMNNTLAKTAAMTTEAHRLMLCTLAIPSEDDADCSRTSDSSFSSW